MHWMRHFVMMTGLSLAVMTLISGRAEADLIESNPSQTFPDLFGGNVNGKISYTYNDETERGTFTSINLPTYIATGQDTSSGGPDELAVVPTAEGVRRQVINLTLDKNGKLVEDGANSYELYGTVVMPSVDTPIAGEANGSLTVSGLLLKGTPTEFGSLAIPGSGLSTFDMKMNITGGELADYFGKSAYVEITPKIGSTFDGSFTKDFEGFKVTSNTRGNFVTPPPLNVPEPTTLLIMLTGGAGVAYRFRRRLRG
jgi:hypothetical protein